MMYHGMALCDFQELGTMSNIAAVILAVAVILAAGLVAGRYTVSSVLQLGDSAGGVFIVDRLTGAVRYCGVAVPNLGCRPIQEHSN